MKRKTTIHVSPPSEADIHQTLAHKREIQQHLTERARRDYPRRLFCQLLDDYFQALTAKELPSDIAVPRQTAIDESRLAIIKEYERFAGRNAAISLEARQMTERCLDDMRRSLSKLTCPKNSPGSGSDPVHEHTDGRWWFWDETWADELGPFKDRVEANTACKDYADQLLGPQWSDPSNKRGAE